MSQTLFETLCSLEEQLNDEYLSLQRDLRIAVANGNNEVVEIIESRMDLTKGLRFEVLDYIETISPSVESYADWAERSRLLLDDA